jgi:hypothetical protein
MTFDGTLVDDGAKAKITLVGDAVNIRRLPVETTEGEITILIGYTDEEVAKKVARLQKRHPAISLLSTETSTEEPLTAQAELVFSVDTWPRFAAKTALGLASLVVRDESWLDTAEARLLRDVLWNGHPESREQEGIGTRGVAWSPAPRPVDTPLLVPPEHLLSFEVQDVDERLVIVVFGDLGYQLPLALDWSDFPQQMPQSWWFGKDFAGGRQLPTSLQYGLLLNR